jgi:hypothetical protein
MDDWRIVDETDLDRLEIVNADAGCALYLPHWSTARIDTAHSPPESGINAELLSYRTKDNWTCSLSHIENLGETCTPAYLLEVWIDYCLVTKVQLPFAFGEQLRQRWLEKSDPHLNAITRGECGASKTS